MSELTLPPRIGNYTVEREIGRGGMGIVYLARDAKLDRPVAIKVLPDAFALDADRLARFEREARLLASLSHPNIAGIYGLEEAGERRFLVLEYVEGETLAQRIVRGALPVDDCIDVCRQIAAAVEAAHESGVIHRDLKPGNVKLTPAGDVKVLDFGLAKGGAGSGVSSDPSLTASPTVALTAMTGAGVILGTAAYMSPEQARGRAVDRRTDIWSFGCVLYECLTGRQAFAGETVSDMIAMILQGEPDWKALPANTPPHVRALLERCLTKDAKKRLRDIGEARLVLEGGAVSAPVSGVAPAAIAPARARALWLAYGVAGAFAVACAVMAWMLAARTPPPAPAIRLIMPAPEVSFFLRDAAAVALSPDGTQLALAMKDTSTTSAIWLRPMDQPAGHRLEGTDGAQELAWSPDGRYILFSTSGKLEKLDTRGGAPEVLCPLKNQGRGASWGSRGVIVFSPSGEGPIYKVSKDGGTPAPATQLDSAETSHRFPRFLPDGTHFLYAALPARGDDYKIYVGSIDSPGRMLLMTAGGTPVYVDPGYLLFTRNARLVAQRFDAARRQLQGEPTVLRDEPQSSNYLGAPALSASNAGAIAYYAHVAEPLELAWFDRSGKITGRVPAPIGPYETIALSPDGTRAAVVKSGSGNNESDLWIVDLSRGTTTRFTYGPGRVDRPVWSPDGSRIAFSSNRNGRWDIFVKSTTGAAPEEPLVTAGSILKYPSSWSPDGRSIVFENLSEKTGWDLWEVSVDGAHATHPLIATPFDEMRGHIATAGDWIAYDSNESGTNMVYVQSYPALGNKHPTSTGNAVGSYVRADGREILHGEPGGAAFVGFDPATGMTAGAPDHFVPPSPLGAFAMLGDFSRGVALVRPDGATAPTDLTLLLNWRAELAKK